MDISTSIRTAAVIYADEPTAKTVSIKRKFIESVFLTNENAELTIAELANKIYEIFELSFSEEELDSIIANETDKYFLVLGAKYVENKKISLLQSRYLYLYNKETKNDITQYIDEYLLQHPQVSIQSESIQNLLNRYFYELLNTNISAYSQLLNPKKDAETSIKVESKNFTPAEIDIINDFLNWNNIEKNKAIFKLLSYALEYALVSNNARDNVYLSSLRTKIFYLDTNLLYRALGINGDTRKKRTTVFLKKCKESGQKLIISLYTKKEFEESIDFHISQLKSSQFGRINPAIFDKYCYGESIYQYYHEWRKGRITYGFDIFKAHLVSEYKKLLKLYNIDEDYKTPLDSDIYDKKIEQYKEEIARIKYTKREQQHHYDACNLLWLELNRGNNNINLIDCKYYFISTDQKLKQWDESHSLAQPLLLLPSQWMTLILKYFSRTDDDFKSFISFLNLPKNDSILTETDLQIVLAGISEITEDFDLQDHIVADMVASKFKGILEKQDYSKTRESAKQFAKDKLEDHFKEQIAAQKKEYNKITENTQEAHKQAIQELESRLKNEFERRFSCLLIDKDRERLRDVKAAIDGIEKRKTTAEERAQTIFSIRKFIAAFIVLSYYVVLIIVVHRVGFEQMGFWLWGLGLFPIVGPILYILIKNETFSLSKILQEMKDKVRQKEYDEYQVSISELTELKLLEEEIKQRLENK
ncbi:hypothetical protein [Alistipes shahii]|uniref:hypothetical protein n=2 Tax=Alistipes shahii TaxID=328814 RepID=UPI00321A83FD